MSPAGLRVLRRFFAGRGRRPYAAAVLADLEPFLHLVAVGGGLLVVLMLLVWLGRGSRGARSERAQTVVGLTPGHALHVVELEGRRLLVGTGPSGPPRLLLELDGRGPTMWSAPGSSPPEFGVGPDAPPWVADAALRGVESWGAHGR